MKVLKGTEKQIKYAEDLLNKFNIICKLAKDLLIKGEATEREINNLNDTIKAIEEKKISDKSWEIIDEFKRIDEQILILNDNGEKINLYEIKIDDFGNTEDDIEKAYNLGKNIQFKLEDFV